MPGTAAKKWRRRSDARPGELAAAALELFAEQGYAATRLEDVATRAGVSKATIYRYFESKEALFEAVVREAVAPRFAEAALLVEAFEGSSEDLLRTFFQVARRALAGPFPALIKLIVSESGNFPELASLWADLVAARILALARRIVERGIERGEFCEVEPSAIAPLVMAPVFLLAVTRQTFAHTTLQLDEAAVLGAHVDLLLRALGPPKEKERDG